MGQYFIAVDIDKQEMTRPAYYDDGTKLMEFSWQGTGFMKAVDYLMRHDWKNDRVLFVGDYTEFVLKRDFWTGHSAYLMDIAEKFGTKNLYGVGWRENKIFDIDSDVTSLKMSRYAINPVSEEYVDLKAQPICGTWIYENRVGFSKIHPLSILLCTSNGMGGGDYHGINEDRAGSWVSDCAEAYLSNKEPEGYNNIGIFLESGCDFFSHFKPDERPERVLGKNLEIIKATLKQNPGASLFTANLFLNEREKAYCTG